MSTKELYWEEHGGQGPHLLLVHGILSSKEQWIDNLQALGEFCRPVVVDLLGHGRSPSPDSPEAYRPTAYMAQFEQIRNALGVEQWYVCGYSLGAGLTIRYAHNFPQRVPAHIFTNSASGFAEPARVAAWQSKTEENADRIEAGGLPAIERISVHPRHARKLPSHISEALLEDAKLLNPTGIANTFRYTNPEVSVRDLVRENQTPALLVCGQREKRFADNRAYINEHMPNVEIVDVEAGHGVNMEASQAFNEAVRLFLEKNPMK